MAGEMLSFVSIVIALWIVICACDKNVSVDPSSLCVSGMNNSYLNSVYEYQHIDISVFKLHGGWFHEYNNTLAIFASNTSWVILQRENSENLIVKAYCTNVLQVNYPMYSDNHVGNPSDCQEWEPSYVKVSSNLNKGCVAFPTKLNSSDRVWIVICCLVASGFMAMMIPCCGKNKCHKKLCAKENYDAVELETYKDILRLQS